MASASTLPFKQPLTKASIWHKVDAQGFRVGRLASQIAVILLGKNKPIYSPAADAGDYVVVYNAERVLFTGQKWTQKLYRWHTRYPGGLKEVQAKDMLYRHPDNIIRKAVAGMLPKNKLRKVRMRKLRIYVGPQHPHDAQVSPSVQFPFVQHVPNVRKALRDLEDDALWRKQSEAVAAEEHKIKEDPESYLARWGGWAMAMENQKEGMEITSRHVKGTDPIRTGTELPRNTRTKRTLRIDRLRNVVTNIHDDVKRHKAKRERLEV